jgi:N-acetylmuramoyl-L-alanine amidase
MTSRSRLAAAALGATAAAAPTVVAATTYVVRPGDTLTAIAARHGTTVSALAAANRISDPDLVRVGQLLRIPDTAAGLPGYTAGAPDMEQYTVQPGDRLSLIARRFGMDLAALARANRMGVHALLRPGTVLAIPGRLARVDALLTRVATQQGIDARLVRAVAWMESGWQQHVVSPTGAVGLMQVEPSTGDWISRYLAQRPLDLSVAEDNVLSGCLLLRHLLTIHGADVDAALAAYYQGDASIARNGLYADTLRYRKVVAALIRQE